MDALSKLYEYSRHTSEDVRRLASAGEALFDENGACSDHDAWSDIFGSILAKSLLIIAQQPWLEECDKHDRALTEFLSDFDRKVADRRKQLGDHAQHFAECEAELQIRSISVEDSPEKQSFTDRLSRLWRAELEMLGLDDDGLPIDSPVKQDKVIMWPIWALRLWSESYEELDEIGWGAAVVIAAMLYHKNVTVDPETTVVKCARVNGHIASAAIPILSNHFWKIFVKDGEPDRYTTLLSAAAWHIIDMGSDAVNEVSRLIHVPEGRGAIAWQHALIALGGVYCEKHGPIDPNSLMLEALMTDPSKESAKAERGSAPARRAKLSSSATAMKGIASIYPLSAAHNAILLLPNKTVVAA